MGFLSKRFREFCILTLAVYAAEYDCDRKLGRKDADIFKSRNKTVKRKRSLMKMAKRLGGACHGFKMELVIPRMLVVRIRKGLPEKTSL